MRASESRNEAENTRPNPIDRRRVEMRAAGLGRLRCLACARTVSVVSIEQASSITGVPIEALSKQIQGRGLHFRRTLSGSLLVCLESLIRVTRTAAGEEDCDSSYLCMR